ncbi:MAG: hypothetical protein ACXVXP_00265 [Mycobacteriaceae bacterium]
MTGGLLGDARKRNLALVPCCDAAAAVARVEALIAEWERRTDAVAITYQDPDARHRVTAEPRRVIASLRAALDGAAGGGGGS